MPICSCIARCSANASLAGDDAGGDRRAHLGDRAPRRRGRARRARPLPRRACSAARSAASSTAAITGVARFGLFVTVAESGADGLVPISSLPADFYRHDPRRHRLVGRRSRRIFALGDAVTVRLIEADPIGGRLVFRLDETDLPAPLAATADAAADARSGDSHAALRRLLIAPRHLRLLSRPRPNGHRQTIAHRDGP